VLIALSKQLGLDPLSAARANGGVADGPDEFDLFLEGRGKPESLEQFAARRNRDLRIAE